jgi:hypothetical protein
MATGEDRASGHPSRRSRKRDLLRMRAVGFVSFDLIDAEESSELAGGARPDSRGPCARCDRERNLTGRRKPNATIAPTPQSPASTIARIS